jgi:hypothetical protein
MTGVYLLSPLRGCGESLRRPPWAGAPRLHSGGRSAAEIAQHQNLRPGLCDMTLSGSHRWGDWPEARGVAVGVNVVPRPGKSIEAGEE